MAACACVSALGILLAAAPPAVAQGNVSNSRTAISARTAASMPSAADVGALPSSQKISLTLTLAPSTDRAAALDQFLAAVVTPSSPSYHQWVTPSQFAASYGATADQLAATTAWAQANGLSVDAVSPSSARVSVSGSTSQVEAAFAVSMHSYQVNGGLYYAPQAKPSLPSTAGAIAAVDGLDNLPMNSGGSTVSAALSLPTLAATVDANTTPILNLDATAATGALSDAQVTGYRSLFRQAAAQGITALISRTAVSTGFPSDLTDVTAVALPGDVADTTTPVDARPTWQNAPGLPADTLRYGPDLTVSSLSALSQTLSSIALRAGGRLGNVNATLYELGPTPGLYTQPDAVAAGTWEASTGLGVTNLAKLAAVFPTGTAGTQVSVTSSTGSPIHGQSFTLSTTVTATAGGGATPTGTVTFTASQAGFTSTTVSLGGSASATTSALLIPGGTYNITATYSGDSNYASSSSSLFSLTVQPEAAQFTISAPASMALGDTITSTVTVASASGFGTPNVSVTVTPSGITGAAAATQTLTGSNGQVTGSFSFASTQAGTASFQAQCTPADSSFTCFTPQTASTTVPQATPKVGLSITPNSPSAGAAVTLSAQITGVAGINPTGSVQFFDGTTSLGFGSAPNATYTTSSLLPGQTHSITAAYLGDNNYVKVTSAASSVSVGTATTTTSVIASATAASYGQTISLNITVAGSSTVNGTLPTGTLTFSGAGTVTSALLSGGSANVSLSSLPVGTYTITTSYSGDTNYAASTGNTVVVTVAQSVASLNPSISSTSFTTGSTSTLTVTVTLPGNAQLPTGSMFVATIAGLAGASYTGTFNVNTGGNTGTGSVIIPAPIAGSYTLQVTCAVNTNFACTPAALSISSTATTGTTAGTTPTTTVLTYSPTAPVAGQALTLTATVSASSSAITSNPISGSVIFYDGTTQVGTGVITASGTTYTATTTATLTGTSPHSLTATYGGNTIYAASTSTAVALSTGAASTSISLSANTSSVLAGVSVTFTAIVGGSTTAGVVPTGTVSFYLGGSSPALLGTATLSASGGSLATAVFSTSTLPSGSDQIYAVYKGDANFSTVTSATISLGLTDYNVTFVPQFLTLKQGTTGLATLILGTVNNFSGSVVFGCLPAPNTYVTCSFSPTTLTSGGTTTMTIVTTAAKTSELMPGPLSGKVLGGISFAALVCCLLPGRRRRLPLLLLLFLGLGLSMNLGCSQGNFETPGSALNAGSPLGTTTITINTAGSDGVNIVRHNYTYQVTIQ